MFTVTRGRLARASAIAALLISAAVVAIPGAVDAVDRPQVVIDSPVDNHVVSGDLVVTGTAAHPDGIEQIALVVKNEETGHYWNGSAWRNKRAALRVAPTPAGADQVGWSATVSADDMTAGSIRIKALAKTSNSDRFRRGEAMTIKYRPGLDVNLYDTAIATPTNGSNISGPIVISGSARSTAGVEAVRVVIRNTETARYWNGETQAWSDDFVRTNAQLSEPGATAVDWSLSVPTDKSEPGSYFTRAWVLTAHGHGDPFGRGRASFTVTRSDDEPTTTTTVAPTTTTSTTTLSSTSRWTMTR